MSDSLQPHGPHQAPLSMGFPRQEHWSRLIFPSPGDLPNPGDLPEDPEIKPRSPALQADSLPSEPPEKPVGCQISDQGEQGATLLNDLESWHSRRDWEGQKKAWVVCTPKKLGHKKVFS